MNHSLHTEITKNHFIFKHCISLISILSFLSFSILLFINLTLKSYIPNHYLITGLCLSIPLCLHNYWPKKINFLQPYYWLIVLCYFLPFQFSLLLLLNQNEILFHLIIIVALVVLILLTNTLFIFPIIFIGVLASCSIYCSTSKAVFFEHNIFITTFTSFVIVFLLCAIEFHKQKHQERTLDHFRLISGSIAHELRTPISAILLGLHSLKIKFLQTSVTPSFFNIITQMESASKNAFTTIDIILNNIRDHKEIKKSPISLSDSVALAVEEYPLSPTEKQFIHLNLDKNYFINGNFDLLKLVIWNLLKNSIYQIKKHNKGEIYINFKSTTNTVVLTFRDTANGITDDEAPNLFEKFYSTTKNGSGLGLASCKEIIQSHNGQIDFDYSPGNYIEFIISLPILT